MMIIKKRYERLLNIGNYENIKVCTEIENEVVLKEGLTGAEKASTIKSKGLALGKLAQSITDDEIIQVVEKLKKEKEHGGDE